MTEKEFNKIFAENLNYYMGKNGTSRGELAKLLDVSVTSVANWCNALKTPRMDKVDRLCAHFGIRRSDLMSERDSDMPNSASPADHLTASESALLEDFRQLNEEGQDIIRTTASGLVASGRYIKSDELELVGSSEEVV